MPKTLEEKREQMLGFLLENIVCKTKAKKRQIERRGREIVFTDNRGVEYSVTTISRASDFPYDFDKNPARFDEGRRELVTITDQFGDFIDDKNRQGLVPGFVFLQSDTDFNQLKERTTRIINRGSFLKQVTPSQLGLTGTYDCRFLTPLELSLENFYRNNSVCKDQKTTYAGSLYYPGLIYFNPKENKLDIVWFMNTSDPSEFRNTAACNSCRLPNGPEYDHQACKRERNYIFDYVIPRDNARFGKAIRIMKQRRTLDSRCETQAEKGVRFMPADLIETRLYAPSEEVKVALIK
jgi:hypothetical protein